MDRVGELVSRGGKDNFFQVKGRGFFTYEIYPPIKGLPGAIIVKGREIKVLYR